MLSIEVILQASGIKFDQSGHQETQSQLRLNEENVNRGFEEAEQSRRRGFDDIHNELSVSRKERLSSQIRALAKLDASRSLLLRMDQESREDTKLLARLLRRVDR